MKTTTFPSDLFPATVEPMRHVLHEEKAQLNGITLRLLRCQDETKPKTKEGEPEPPVQVGRTKNELVASFYDEKRSKYRDFIRMTVADILPEAMPQFLAMSIKTLAIMLPKFNDRQREKQLVDCVTVSSYSAFAEAMMRREK